MMYVETYDDLVYESWIVDECGDAIMKCCDMTDDEIHDLLDNHPEWSVRCLPR